MMMGWTRVFDYPDGRRMTDSRPNHRGEPDDFAHFKERTWIVYRTDREDRKKYYKLEIFNGW
jgi:hypothetical protein